MQKIHSNTIKWFRVTVHFFSRHDQTRVSHSTRSHGEGEGEEEEEEEEEDEEEEEEDEEEDEEEGRSTSSLAFADVLEDALDETCVGDEH